MGSPEFAVPALRALHDAGHEIAAVYTQPPRPAGRGHAVHPSPVQCEAARLHLPVRTPSRLRRDERAQADFATLRLDAAVVAAYGLILPPTMLDAPTRGCLNIHASLLPRWRGAAPIQAAILAGDAGTGISIMRMDEGLDTGPVLLQETVPITSCTTAAGLHDRLAELGARLILRTLDEEPPAVPQGAGATYAPKLTRADGRIDWSRDAAALDRQVRGMNPWPGAYTTLGGRMFKVLSAILAEGSGVPGTVLDGSCTVASGLGALRPTRVQLAGRPATDIAAFLRGHPVPPGTVLGAMTH